MATKYICDVCEEEFSTSIELGEVKIIPNVNKAATRAFDICPKCSNKMFKPVVAYHWTMRISIDCEDETKEE